jgi:exo-beta-1,3-glucanase (GH17 family)
MKLKYSILLIFIISILGWNFYNCCEESTVEINDRNFLVNNERFFIKGICYDPVPLGHKKRSFDKIDEDLKLMVEAGVNTIRVYSPIDDISVLDKIDKAGIKIIVGFGYNQEGYYDILSGSFKNYIKKYKNHNAILLWELGNEYNYHPEWFEGDINNWYEALNKAAYKIKQIDSSRPVTTAHGEIPEKTLVEKLENIDAWGINVYRWDDPSDLFEEWLNISEKPLYLSEAGSDSYMTVEKYGYNKGENQLAQADANAKILDVVFNNSDTISGVLIFQFVDGLWKAGNPDKQDIGGWAPNSIGVPYDGAPNEEFWGIVDIKRNKKKTFEVIKNKYNNN